MQLAIQQFRPSVRLSHSGIVSKHVVEILTQPNRPIILSLQNSPPNVGLKYRKAINCAIGPTTRCISETALMYNGWLFHSNQALIDDLGWPLCWSRWLSVRHQECVTLFA